jgi:hypothetical protein
MTQRERTRKVKNEMAFSNFDWILSFRLFKNMGSGLEVKDVLGKAFTIYWSWNSQESAVRWNRLGHLIY